VRPVATYSHQQGCSITGGYVYRGRDVPALAGAYVFGDYCSGLLWTLRDGGGPQLMSLRVPGLTSFAEDASGELYALSDRGRLYRFGTGSPPP
jgi:hypothetical protein